MDSLPELVRNVRQQVPESPKTYQLAINDLFSDLVMKLLYLQSENRRKDINFYINSPGGVVTGGMAIYDTIRFLPCDVVTEPTVNAVFASGTSVNRTDVAPASPEFEMSIV